MSEDLIKYEESKQLPAELVDDMAEASKENIQGVTPRLPKVQMPTGGGKIFTLEVINDEDRDEEELRGIILYQSPAKAYWHEAFGGGGVSVVPDCASHDGLKPATGYPDPQAQQCAECQHNRFGTATGPDGNKLPGKACRDVKRIVLLLEGSPEIPYLLTVPPTGIRNFDDYLIRLRKDKRPFWSVMTKVTLVTDTNKQGIKYPKAVFDVKGYINDKGALAQIQEWQRQWKEMLRSTMFADTDVKPYQESGLSNNREPEYVPPGKTEF